MLWRLVTVSAFTLFVNVVCTTSQSVSTATVIHTCTPQLSLLHPIEQSWISGQVTNKLTGLFILLLEWITRDLIKAQKRKELKDIHRAWPEKVEEKVMNHTNKPKQSPSSVLSLALFPFAPPDLHPSNTNSLEDSAECYDIPALDMIITRGLPPCFWAQDKDEILEPFLKGLGVQCDDNEINPSLCYPAYCVYI